MPKRQVEVENQVWRCPLCGAKITTPIPSLEVSHPCPKRGNGRVWLRLEK